VALRTALAGKLADGELVLADLGGFTAPSARSARKVLADLGNPRRTLIILAERNEHLWKSFRNFPGIKVRTSVELCAFDVVHGGLVLAESAAMVQLNERVGLSKADAAKAGGDA
jgi:large subunit ribosomal protein L4